MTTPTSTVGAGLSRLVSIPDCGEYLIAAVQIVVASKLERPDFCASQSEHFIISGQASVPLSPDMQRFYCTYIT